MREQPEGRKRPTERGPSADANTGWVVISLLFAGLLTWGAIGWIFDQIFGTGFFLPVGLIAGMVGSLYLVIRRFGTMTSDRT